MRSLLKDAARPIYRFIKDKNRREFHRLYDKWGRYKRFSEIKNVNFLDYIFDIPDTPSFIWQFKEIFVDELYRFETDSKEPVIYDCGANIGMSCLYFKKLYPNARIRAFEADPKLAEVLKKNLSKNGITDIEIIDKAVWIDENGIEFSTEGADGGSIYGAGNRIEMESIRLKNYLENEDKVDMLKIDIEGAEYDVLKDCEESLENVQNIFVEYHSWNGSEQRLSEILKVFEKNRFRYYIEGLTKRKHPFVNRGEDENMDLQLNIFGVKR